MKKIKKHIAILLIGVFIFPIAFQSLHTVQHHACAHLHQDLPEYNHSQSAADITQSISSENFDRQNPCPICNYRFSILNIPNTVVYQSILPLIEKWLKITIESIPFFDIHTVTSPRAPPYC